MNFVIDGLSRMKPCDVKNGFNIQIPLLQNNKIFDKRTEGIRNNTEKSLTIRDAVKKELLVIWVSIIQERLK